VSAAFAPDLMAQKDFRWLLGRGFFGKETDPPRRFAFTVCNIAMSACRQHLSHIRLRCKGHADADAWRPQQDSGFHVDV